MMATLKFILCFYLKNILGKFSLNIDLLGFKYVESAPTGT